MSDELIRAAALGAISGVRSMAGVRAVSRPESPARWLALGESLLDKMPFVPARTQLPSLVGRAVLGAYSASQVTDVKQRRFAFAALGALAAIGTAYLACALRTKAAERSRIAGFAVGLAEDGVIDRVGSWVGRKTA